MFIKIDLNSDVPIYIQIKNEIIEGIAKGEIKEGDTLPPVRRLAEELGINLHTVNKAYNLLRQEGLISLNRKKGAVIISRDKSVKDLEKLEKVITPIVNEYYCKNFTREDFKIVIDKIFDKFDKIE